MGGDLCEMQPETVHPKSVFPFLHICMSTLTLNSRKPFRSGLRTAFAALAASAVLLSAAPKLWADAAQDLVSTQVTLLAPGKTILNVSATLLATAVANAITSNTNPAITPDQIAANTFLPIGIAVRADRNTSAPKVAASAISATLALSGTPSSLALTVGKLVDAVVVVNGTSKGDLSITGREAVAKSSVAALSDLAPSASGTDAAGLSLKAIGTQLAADPTLTSANLLSILESGISGAYGAKGLNKTEAPIVADNFVEGTVSSGAPGGDFVSYAKDILKKVSANGSIDAVVAYQVALAGGTSSVVPIGTTLYTAYPSQVTRVTEGLLASVAITSSTSDANRVSTLGSLVAAKYTVGASALAAAAFVDPNYAGQFTTAAFNAVSASRPTLATANAAVRAAASKAAGLVGAILGQDGDALTQVAQAYSNLVATNTLLPSSAGTYALALINGAVKSTIPTTGALGTAVTNVGGKLNGGNLAVGITQAVLDDLASVVDLFSAGIVRGQFAAGGGNLSGGFLTRAASEVGTLVTSVARLAKNEALSAKLGNANYVASFLAGSAANTIANLGTLFSVNIGSTAQADILSKIQTDVSAASLVAVKADIAAQFTSNGYTADQAFGTGINFTETPITNL